ncbi:MAG TPA: diphosphomevalonate decarboxylase [Candidatus Thermoplasmatota archaeon]|nr:diphosphomevalonate decarboxylase [Candidatus Thermoplasmatota archaeon]
MKATAVAHPNIALIKYWGRLDDDLNLPLTNSLSMTLDALSTTTTVEWDPRLKDHEVTINGEPQQGKPRFRVAKHLERLKERLHHEGYARVASVNNFPMGSGIASSASAFAALTGAAFAALGIDADAEELTTFARLGSGSAARSIHGGFVEWVAGARHEDSYAYQLAPESHWDLKDVVVVVSEEEKKVGSTEGHEIARTSPFLDARLAHLHTSLALARASVLERDLKALGEVAELDALSMHAVMMTSSPSLLYWSPETVRLLQAVRRFRDEELEAYFTLDAGPNVHLLTTAANVDDLVGRLREEGIAKERILVNGPGPGLTLEKKHLF